MIEMTDVFSYLSWNENEVDSLIIDFVNKFKEKEMLHQGKEYWNRHAPILFPIVGQIKNGETKAAFEYPHSTGNCQIKK